MNYTLIFYYSQEPQDSNANKIDTPAGPCYVRVVVYRGGGDVLDWAERNKRPSETLLNTIEVK